jgi:hypothetical protein
MEPAKEKINPKSMGILALLVAWFDTSDGCFTVDRSIAIALSLVFIQASTM